MCKRVKMNSYEPFVRDKPMKFVTHSWYNKTFSFGTPFEFLKTYKIFQCSCSRYSESVSAVAVSISSSTSFFFCLAALLTVPVQVEFGLSLLLRSCRSHPILTFASSYLPLLRCLSFVRRRWVYIPTGGSCSLSRRFVR